MLTRRRAQRLVLKPAEPERLEAYRFLTRRYEAVSMVTTVSKLVDLPATTCGGDLMDSLTDFERRVTSWEHEAKETLSDLIRIGVVSKVWRKVGFGIMCSSTLLARQNGRNFVKEIENVEFARRNTQPVPMDLSAMGSQNQKFQGNCSWCGTHGHLARDCRKKTEYLQNNQTSGWSGTDDKTKGKPGKGKGKQDKGKGKGKPSKSRGKGKNKERARQEREGHEDRNKKHKPVNNTQSGRTGVGITLTTGLTKTGSRATAAQICGLILQGSKRQDNCHRRSRLKNSPIQRMEAAFQC